MHAHVPWSLVVSASLEETDARVRANIEHDYKLVLRDADTNPLFWFYIKTSEHPAVGAMTTENPTVFV